MIDRDTEVFEGQILAGKYRIEQILGKGGMGVVVAATHVQLEEKVALKFLLPEALTNEEAVRRFEREARAAVKIKSEHVARVIDVGTLETGSPYMVMEFLEGCDLGEYVARNGVLEPQAAAECLLQACEAIAEAHALGIVHRDLKPANLFRIVRADGTPSIKVLDFGISKVMAEGGITKTSSMMGSPYYMSPEQMTSARTVDARTDIWALGVILHELLTGRVPYEGDTIPEICVQILQAPVPQLSATRPDLPDGLDQIIACALKKERDERYPDVAAFAHDLAVFCPQTGRSSSERIARVLGLSRPPPSPRGVVTERFLTGEADGRGSVLPASEVQFSERASPSTLSTGTPEVERTMVAAGSSDGRDADAGKTVAQSTFIGASTTRPGSSRARNSPVSRWLLLVALLSLVAGAIFMAVGGSGHDSELTSPEVAAVPEERELASPTVEEGAVVEPSVAPLTQSDRPAPGRKEVAATQTDVEKKKPDANEPTLPVAKPAVTKPAPKPAPVVAKPAPVAAKPAPRVVPRPSPVAKPATPEPAPKKPSASDLFLDRK